MVADNATRRVPHWPLYMRPSKNSQQHALIAGRLRQPHPQAKVRGFGIDIASTRAQRRGAASGPYPQSEGVEPVRIRRLVEAMGKASSNGLDFPGEGLLTWSPLNAVGLHFGRSSDLPTTSTNCNFIKIVPVANVYGKQKTYPTH